MAAGAGPGSWMAVFMGFMVIIAGTGIAIMTLLWSSTCAGGQYVTDCHPNHRTGALVTFLVTLVVGAFLIGSGSRIQLYTWRPKGPPAR